MNIIALILACIELCSQKTMPSRRTSRSEFSDNPNIVHIFGRARRVRMPRPHRAALGRAQRVPVEEHQPPNIKLEHRAGKRGGRRYFPGAHNAVQPLVRRRL